MNKQKKLDSNLEYLKLSHIKDNYKSMTAEAAKKQLAHMQFLTSIIESEVNEKLQRASERRIKQARFPVLKTLEQFQWDYPENINRDLVRHLFGLDFIEKHANAIFLGSPGLGKTHLAVALSYHACMHGYNVRFETAINVINRLDTAQKAGNFGQVLRSFTRPDLLCLDELGYLPVDQRGADLLFQVISSRYETGSMILTSNRQFNQWPVIFDNDKTITSAILDRLLHHCEVVVIEGTSFRMKNEKTNHIDEE
jgi:DNA replication protein DnaC